VNDNVYSLLSDIRTTQLTQAEANGRMEAKLDALAGPEGRVTKLEKAAVRQWWISIAIAPALAGLHQLLRKLGAAI
jgi:hypothetical protein